MLKINILVLIWKWQWWDLESQESLLWSAQPHFLGYKSRRYNSSTNIAVIIMKMVKKQNWMPQWSIQNMPMARLVSPGQYGISMKALWNPQCGSCWCILTLISMWKATMVAFHLSFQHWPSWEGSTIKDGMGELLGKRDVYLYMGTDQDQARARWPGGFKLLTNFFLRPNFHWEYQKIKFVQMVKNLLFFFLFLEKF